MKKESPPGLIKGYLQSSLTALFAQHPMYSQEQAEKKL